MGRGRLAVVLLVLALSVEADVAGVAHAQPDLELMQQQLNQVLQKESALEEQNAQLTQKVHELEQRADVPRPFRTLGSADDGTGPAYTALSQAQTAQATDTNNPNCPIKEMLAEYTEKSIGFFDKRDIFEKRVCPQKGTGLEGIDTRRDTWRCPTDCACVINCSADCPDFPLEVSDQVMCFNESLWQDEVKSCKGTLNEVQQMLMQIQGGIGLLQSLTVMGVTRAKAIIKTSTPFKIMITEQVLRSSFVLMGLTGGALAIARSSYMYMMYTCDQKESAARVGARFIYNLLLYIALAVMSLVLLVDRILQEFIVKKNVKEEIKKADYKMTRRLEMSAFVDHPGESELELWDDLFDRYMASREFMEMSTKAFLFHFGGAKSLNFQLLDAYSIIGGAYIIQHAIWYSFISREPRQKWFVPERHRFFRIVLILTIGFLAGALYLTFDILEMDKTEKLVRIFSNVCAKHIPDAYATGDIIDDRDKRPAEAEGDETAENMDAEEESESEALNVDVDVDNTSVEEAEKSLTDLKTVAAAGANILQMSLLQTGLTTTQPEPNYPKWVNTGYGSKNFCQKWRLCLSAEHQSLSDLHDDRTKKMSEVQLERYASCWVLARNNPKPELLWHVPKK